MGESTDRKQYKMNIEIFSFFSGLGFLDLGFEDAGFNIVFVNEKNKMFLEAYKYARREKHKEYKYGYSNQDIQNYLNDTFWMNSFQDYNNREQRIIGFIGGPPCPDFSAAGKNRGELGKNGQLTEVYVDLIIKRKPDFFVLENVKGLYQTKKHKLFYEKLKRKLYRAGYSLFDSIENALEYGTPQYRDRLILIGFSRKRFGNNIKYTIGNHKKYDMQLIEHCEWPTKNIFKIDNKKLPPQNIIKELTVEYWFRKNDVLQHKNANEYFNTKANKKFNSIQEGDTSGKSFKRLHRWRYSPTAAYGNNEVHLHPYKARRISVAEALAIQSLPAWFEIKSDLPLSTKFKMVSNGVPYLLSVGIALDLYEWIQKAIQNDIYS